MEFEIGFWISTLLLVFETMTWLYR